MVRDVLQYTRKKSRTVFGEKRNFKFVLHRSLVILSTRKLCLFTFVLHVRN